MPTDKLYPAQTVAKKLKVCGSTLTNWRQNGLGPVFEQKGSRFFYRKSELDKFLATHARTNGGTKRTHYKAIPPSPGIEAPEPQAEGVVDVTDDPIAEDGFAWGKNQANALGISAKVTAPVGASYTNSLLNEREKTHGDWKFVSRTTQELKLFWNVNADLTNSQREALDMIATKLARIVCGNPNEPDHWRDIAGYATLVAENLDDKPPIG